MSAQGPSSADETITLRDAFVARGRAVPFESGWTWLAAAWSIFKRAAGVWTGPRRSASGPHPLPRLRR